LTANVDVEVGDLVDVGEQRGDPHEVHHQPRGDRVELAHVPERERPQERPQRRRRPPRGQHPAHVTVAQQVHPGERVRAGDHPRDQGSDLRARVRPRRPRDPHMGTDQLMEPGPLGQREHRDQPRTRDQVRIIETR